MACINQLPPAFGEDCPKSRRTPQITEVTITKEMNPKIVGDSLVAGNYTVHLKGLTKREMKKMVRIIESGEPIKFEITQ